MHIGKSKAKESQASNPGKLGFDSRLVTIVSIAQARRAGFCFSPSFSGRLATLATFCLSASSIIIIEANTPGTVHSQYPLLHLYRHNSVAKIYGWLKEIAKACHVERSENIVL